MAKHHNLRHTILARRDALPPEQRSALSSKIMDLLQKTEEINQAASFFIYVNFRSEVETLSLIHHLLQQDKIITVPWTDCKAKRLLAVRITAPEQDLAPGYCNIPEPRLPLRERERFDPSQLDVVIAPGSVFDRHGGRMGYGGGFYDRFLVQDAPQALRIALAYDLQMVDRLTLQPHDQSMDLIVTQSTIHRFNRESPHENHSSLPPSPVSGP